MTTEIGDLIFSTDSTLFEVLDTLEIPALATQVDAVNARLDIVNEQLTQLGQIVDNNQINNNTQFATINTTIDNLQTQVNNLSIDTTGLVTRVDALELLTSTQATAIGNMQNLIVTLNVNVLTLQVQQANTTTNVTNLQNQVNAHTTQLETLVNTVNNLTTQAAAQATQITNIQNVNNAQANEITNIQTVNNTQNTNIAANTASQLQWRNRLQYYPRLQRGVPLRFYWLSGATVYYYSWQFFGTVGVQDILADVEYADIPVYSSLNNTTVVRRIALYMLDDNPNRGGAGEYYIVQGSVQFRSILPNAFSYKGYITHTT